MVELQINDNLGAKTLEVDLGTLKSCEEIKVMEFIEKVSNDPATEQALNINIISKANIKSAGVDVTVLFFLLNKMVKIFTGLFYFNNFRNRKCLQSQ